MKNIYGIEFIKPLQGYGFVGIQYLGWQSFDTSLKFRITSQDFTPG